MVKAGDVVQRAGHRWRVDELVTAVGGAVVAQLECLDRDHHAAVRLAGPTESADDFADDDLKRPVFVSDLVALGDDGIDAARRARERTETPKRLRHSMRLHRRAITKATAALDQLRAAHADATARHAAGDMRPVTHPALGVTLEPAALLAIVARGISHCEARIATAQRDLDLDAAALATAEKGGAS